MECRRALIDSNGDMALAAERLAATGQVKAAKRADRVAAEGLVGIAVSGRTGVLVELNTETDFVARTVEFRDAVRAFATLALTVGGDHARLLEAPSRSGRGTVADEVRELVTKTGENVTLRRSASVSVTTGAVVSYTHNAVATDVGKIGVLVALESTAAAAALAESGRKVAMHIAASRPQWPQRADVPTAAIAATRAELEEVAQRSGKPQAVVDKMVEGRLQKFFADVVLDEQPFVFDLDVTVGAARAEAERAVGASIVWRRSSASGPATASISPPARPPTH